jgi:serine/threonine protein kinase
LNCGVSLEGHKTPSRNAAPSLADFPTLDRGTVSGVDTRLVLSSDDMHFSVGSLFADRYEILSEGKKGGMGVVYKVKDKKLNDRIKALKLIHPRLISSDVALNRFRQEVAISQELNHLNIVWAFS